MIITGALKKGRDHYYTQIARDLIDKIAASIYEPGTLLPYEAVLARNYKVSISTIRKSLALLNEIGFAETINTKGTIVSCRLPSSPLIVCRTSVTKKIR